MTDPGNAFVALSPAIEERHAFAAALTEASPGRPLPGKRVRPENWHVTLRFLGPVEDEVCDRIAHELDETLDVEPGRGAFNGLGAFPRASKAAVLYASVEDPEGVLDVLAGIAEEAAVACGLEAEGRPFVPHLTLARLRPPADLRSVFDAFGPHRAPVAFDALTIFRTTREHGRTVYRPLHRLDLSDR